MYRLGLFNQVSARTRLSSGSGFLLSQYSPSSRAPLEFRVRRVDQPDASKNECAVDQRVWHPHSGEDWAPVAAPAAYKFGDVLLRPLATALGVVGFDAQVYRQYAHLEEQEEEEEEEEEEGGGGGGGGGGDRREGAESGAGAGAAPPLPKAMSDNVLWGLFFAKTRDAGIAAVIEMKAVSLEDMEMCEPFLFVGLPALALYHVVVRSLEAGYNGLILEDGRRVVAQTCPGRFVALFQILMDTVKAAAELKAKLGDDDRCFLPQFLLFAGSDREVVMPEGAELSEARQVELKRTFGGLL